MVTGTPMLGTGVLLDLQVISSGWSILNCLPAADRLLSQRSGLFQMLFLEEYLQFQHGHCRCLADLQWGSAVGAGCWQWAVWWGRPLLGGLCQRGVAAELGNRAGKASLAAESWHSVLSTHSQLN